MTSYIILALCIIILLSYIFDITGKYSKIPGVVLLIALGIVLQLLSYNLDFSVPNFEPLLPVIGTVGLILIVMEASLDLQLKKEKRPLITGSVMSAVFLLILTAGVITVLLVSLTDSSVRDSILNAIPLAIISSSVAISSATSLQEADREFVVYESSFSDIAGIIIFDYVLLNQGNILSGLVSFGFSTIITLILAILLTAVLAILLHKTTHHVNYVIIMTTVVMVYVLAKMIHLPALLLVLAFGMILSNNKFLEKTSVSGFVDFEKFREDLSSFKKVLGELTFIVRSFFFIVFGFYIKVEGLFDPLNLIAALSVTGLIVAFRYLFFRFVLKTKVVPLLFYSPRGLITILLFISIPKISRIPLVSEELVTLVILFSIILLTIGNIIHRPSSS